MIVFSQRHPVGGGHRLELLVWHSQERRQDGEGQRLLGFIRHRVLRLWLLRRRERRTEGKMPKNPAQSLIWFMMLKIILLVAIASVYSPVNDVCPGCYRPPSRHADHETASFPHRARDWESDPHHAHAIHSQPSGTERDQHGDYHWVPVVLWF